MVYEEIDEINNFEESGLENNILIDNEELDELQYLDKQEFLSRYSQEIEYGVGLASEEEDSEIKDFVKFYMEKAGSHKLLTQEQEIYLAKRIETGDQKAFEELILHNTRLVISIAKKFRDKGLSYGELLQEGNIGLIKAAKKFDWRMGNKFSTYATWWIRQAIIRALAEQSKLIRHPVHIIDLYREYQRKYAELFEQLAREPSDEEVAESMNIDVEKLKQIKNSFKTEPQSLELTLGDDENQILDFVSEKDSIDPTHLIDNGEKMKALKEALLMLPSREMQILMLRYGMVDGIEYTLEEIAEKFGITRERVRQLEKKALNFLKSPLVQAKLKQYLE